MPLRFGLFSETITAGQRTYFLDIKKTSRGRKYLRITESKEVGPGEFVRHGVLVPEERLSPLVDALHALLAKAGYSATAKSWRLAAIRQKFPKAYAKWTSEEEATLREAHQRGNTIDVIADTLQRQPGAIRSRLIKRGLIAFESFRQKKVG